MNEAGTRRLAHEYRSRSLYRVCGGTLIAAGALFSLSLLAGGGVLPMTMPALRAASTGMRVALLWLCAPAPALAAGGLLAIARHYRGTSKEGWVLLAFATVAIGGALLTLTMALGAVGGPGLVDAAQGDGAVVRPLLLPLALVSRSASRMGGTLFWLGLLPLAVALTHDRLWPRVTAWGAPLVALAEAPAAPLLAAYPGALVTLRLVGYAYLALLGFSALGMVKMMRAAAAEAARSED
ncbi:MAG TPA: hypothetical protein VF832_20895 [Longimicrobiales bacterium]